MENKKKKPGLATTLLHGAYEPLENCTSISVPIHMTTAYQYKDCEYAANIFALTEPGYIYTRLHNPTTDVFEKRMAAIDHGIGALAFASGQQANMVAVLNLLGAGDHIVSAAAIYGGTISMFNLSFPKLGIQTTFVDATNVDQIAKAIRPETKAVFIETIANPKNDILEYDKIADVAHQHGIPVICDNTVATPALFRPIDFGIDFVTYSATKYLNGHGNAMGGVLVDSGRFGWNQNPDRWPQFTRPDPSYHGLVFSEAFGNACYIAMARTHWLRDFGGVISPFNSYMIMQGLETLQLRMERHTSNAQKVAEFLEKHPKVGYVNYPGLPSHPFHDRAKKYFPNGVGGMIGFGIKGGREAGRKFIENMKLACHVANIGDTRTLVIHPASTTHSQQTDEQLAAAGIGPDYIRLCVGIEDIEDILDDLDQALAVTGYCGGEKN